MATQFDEKLTKLVDYVRTALILSNFNSSSARAHGAHRMHYKETGDHDGLLARDLIDLFEIVEKQFPSSNSTDASPEIIHRNDIFSSVALAWLEGKTANVTPPINDVVERVKTDRQLELDRRSVEDRFTPEPASNDPRLFPNDIFLQYALPMLDELVNSPHARSQFALRYGEIRVRALVQVAMRLRDLLAATPSAVVAVKDPCFLDYVEQVFRDFDGGATEINSDVVTAAFQGRPHGALTNKTAAVAQLMSQLDTKSKMLTAGSEPLKTLGKKGLTDIPQIKMSPFEIALLERLDNLTNVLRSAMIYPMPPFTQAPTETVKPGETTVDVTFKG